jgi:hypothetical protein
MRWHSWITRKSGIFRGRNGGQSDNVTRERLKNVTQIELEQRHIIKFLHLKGLKLGNIALKLSIMGGQDAHIRSGIKYWLHHLRIERKDLTT